MANKKWKTEMLVDDHSGGIKTPEAHLVGWLTQGMERTKVSFFRPDYSGILSINRVEEGHLTTWSVYVFSQAQLEELKTKGRLLIEDPCDVDDNLLFELRPETQEVAA
jgi:hypothetical protein